MLTAEQQERLYDFVDYVALRGEAAANAEGESGTLEDATAKSGAIYAVVAFIFRFSFHYRSRTFIPVFRTSLLNNTHSFFFFFFFPRPLSRIERDMVQIEIIVTLLRNVTCGVMDSKFMAPVLSHYFLVSFWGPVFIILLKL